MLALAPRAEERSGVPHSNDDPLERLPQELRLGEILKAFNSSVVDYVVVGGMAAVLHGAEVSTVDLDLVIEQSRANRDRAIDALDMLGAERTTYTPDVTGSGEPLPADGEGLVEPVESFRTRQGNVDLLREALVVGGYNDLHATAQVFFVDDQDVYVASLEAVIVSKEASGSTKDLLHLRSLYDLRAVLQQEEHAEEAALRAEREAAERAAEFGIDHDDSPPEPDLGPDR